MGADYHFKNTEMETTSAPAAERKSTIKDNKAFSPSDQVIRAVNARPETVVFVLWGNQARRKIELVDRTRHVVIESLHPSPLSARRGFFGSKPFSRASEALVAAGREPVDWTL